MTPPETSPKKKAAKKKVASDTSAKSMPPGSRYFELVDDKSSKFWEVGITGAEVTVRYGRTGTNGTTKVKELGDESAAQKQHDKLIDQKTSKGYLEK